MGKEKDLRICVDQSVSPLNNPREVVHWKGDKSISLVLPPEGRFLLRVFENTLDILGAKAAVALLISLGRWVITSDFPQ
jgi:hypothetical protein